MTHRFTELGSKPPALLARQMGVPGRGHPAGARVDPQARPEARPPLRLVPHDLRRAGRRRRQGRGRLRRRLQRRRTPAPEGLRPVPQDAPVARREPRRRGEELPPREDARGPVAPQEPGPEEAHDRPRRRVHREEAARLPRLRRRAPQAARPARRRGGHRDAREHRFARRLEQVDGDAARARADEVLLPLGDRVLGAARTSRRSPSRTRFAASSRPRTPRIPSRTRGSPSCSRARESRSPAGPSRSTARSSAFPPARSAAPAPRRRSAAHPDAQDVPAEEVPGPAEAAGEPSEEEER